MKLTPLKRAEQLIRRSILLTEDRRQALFSKLSVMPKGVLSELTRLLKKEERVITWACNRTIEDAVQHGAPDGIATINASLSKSVSLLRVASESGERTKEKETLEQLLKDIGV